MRSECMTTVNEDGGPCATSAATTTASAAMPSVCAVCACADAAVGAADVALYKCFQPCATSGWFSC